MLHSDNPLNVYLMLFMDFNKFIIITIPVDCVQYILLEFCMNQRCPYMYIFRFNDVGCKGMTRMSFMQQIHVMYSLFNMFISFYILMFSFCSTFIQHLLLGFH